MYVEVSNLSKKIKGKTILHNVSASFEKGTIYGIVGPNGSGKTMLLRAICGFIRPDTGGVTIDNHAVVFNQKLPENVGVIIENPGFILSETALENLKYLADINRSFDKEETDRLLKLFGLSDYANDLVKTYSLGMRQKLAIVQALMEHQNLILFDEPTNGLDEASVNIFLEEMNHQRSLGRTVVIASHHTDELDRIADYLFRIYEGNFSDTHRQESVHEA